MVSRNNAIPEIVVIIPPIINRIEEFPVGSSPPFDSSEVGVGPLAGGGVGVGVKINITVGVGMGVKVGVILWVGVAEGVADSDICDPCANMVNDCVNIVSIPSESRVLIVIV